MQRNIDARRAKTGPPTVVRCQCGEVLDSIPADVVIGSFRSKPENAKTYEYECLACHRTLRGWRTG